MLNLVLAYIHVLNDLNLNKVVLVTGSWIPNALEEIIEWNLMQSFQKNQMPVYFYLFFWFVPFIKAI